MANNYSYGFQSMEVYDELHPKLQRIVDELIKHMDVSLLEGIRDKHEQNAHFASGTSQVRWPNGKHNVTDPEQLSRAVDMQPYPYDPSNERRILFMSGLVKGIAEAFGIRVVVGSDWNNNGVLKDQNFHDLFHLELHSSEV